jgi:methylmalonyl-CoA mutase
MTESLAAGFPAASVEDWQRRVLAKSPEAPFKTRLEDGLEVRWLYTPADALAPDPGGLPGHAPYVRGTRLGEQWAIRQEHGAPARRQANSEILEDLEGGATEIALRIDPSGARGVPVTSTDELDEVLDGVLLDLAPVALSAGEDALAAATWLTELWDRRGAASDQLGGSLRLDPIGTLARAGAPERDYQQAMAEAFAYVADFGPRLPRVQVVGVDTGAYVDAGAGAVTELALAIATGLAYLRSGESAGVEPATVAARLEFTFGAGPDQFLELAKFRAARRLWSSVLAHCRVSADQRRSRTYARTSRRMVSSLDPWVNLLRDTTATFAAGVGGADGITVLPFDEAVGESLGQPGPLGRRMARNTQLVLLEESSLHRVADPGGGSWYVEALTDVVARSAWSQLQEIERSGGIVSALSSGRVAERLEAEADRRHEDLAHRQRILTGVNAFPLIGDDGLARPDFPAATEADRPPGHGLPAVRDASAFEHLRAKALDLAKRGEEPTVYLACMGPLAAHVNINLWAKSFFESGGITTVSSGVQPDDQAHAALLREHGLAAAVVCAGRQADAEAQKSLVATLRAAGAHTVYLAGAGAEAAGAAGADVGVRDGVDMVSVLSDLLDRLDAEAGRR